MRWIYLITIVGLVTLSCGKKNGRYIYPEDARFSRANGDPLDSLTFFFPTEIKYSDSVFKTNLDSFRLKWYSCQLYPAKEKILFNYYQKQSVYRFIWLRAFAVPVFISLHKEGKRIWMTTKKLDRQPDFMTMIYSKKPFSAPWLRSGNLKLVKRLPTREKDSVVFPNRHANIIVNEIKELTINEWNEFEEMLSKCNYWSMAPHEETMGLDGSHWIIEASFQDKYWLVDRWSPKDCFRACGEYLIGMSGLKEENY